MIELKSLGSADPRRTPSVPRSIRLAAGDLPAAGTYDPDHLLKRYEIEALRGSPAARGLWKQCFKENHREEARVAVDFVRYLHDKYFLSSRRADTCLVFLRHGAAPLEELARTTPSESASGRTIGIVLQSHMFREFAEQPKIIKMLHEAGILHFNKVVLVDTGFRGSVGKKVIDLLRDQRLLKFTEEEYGIQIPGRDWELGIELLCLREKGTEDADYGLEGYNFVVGRPEDQIFEDAAWLIDEGLTEIGKAEPWPLDRVLITEALVEIARALASAVG